MKTLKSTVYLILAGVLFTFSACEKDKNDPDKPQPKDNEGEVITTLKVVFTAQDSLGSNFTATFKDPDGDGGNGPTVFDTIRLNAYANYKVELILLNETTSPADTISNEVREEDYDHLFCYTVSGPDVAITRTDSDGKYEVGLETEWNVGSISAGTVRIVLKHQPEIKIGSCDLGETDIDVSFVTIVNE